MTNSIFEYLHFKPSESQKKALILFEEFLNSENKFFIIKGYAGTGKTTLLMAFIKLLLDRGILFALCAPTGRAAKIMTDKTGMTALTIHRMIYSYSNIITYQDSNSDKNEYKFYFAIKKNNDLHDAVVIVDESSMISDQYNESNIIRFGSGKLLTDLLKYIDVENNNNKIIFIGDYAQLPPVKSNFSVALSEEYIKNNFECKELYSIELDEVFRQTEDSAILLNATKLRESISCGDFNSFLISEKKGEVTKISENDVINEYFLDFNHFNDTIYENIIITYSNKRAFEYNKKIRQKLFQGKYSIESNSNLFNDKENIPICKDDILLVTKNCYLYKEERDSDNNIELQYYDLYNGEFVKVVEVYPIKEEDVKNIIVHNGKSNIIVNLTFRDVLIQFKDLYSNDIQLKVKIIENLLYSHSSGLTQDEYKALFLDFKERFIKDNLHELEKIRRKSRRFTDIEQTELFKKALKIDPYFNALHVKFGYAITCHKAQGGEWNNVFIDFYGLNNVSQEMFFRWSYTAISRAKHKLYLINIPEYSLDNPLYYENYILEKNLTLPENPNNTIYLNFDKLKSKVLNYAHIEKYSFYDILVDKIENDNQKEKILFKDKKGEVTIEFDFNTDDYKPVINLIPTSEYSFELGQKVLDIYYSEKADIAIANSFNFPHDKIFLKELYEYLIEILSEENITITYIEHKNNCERYYFEKNGLIAIFDFYYKNNKITWVQEKKTNSIEFINLIKGIINNGV